VFGEITTLARKRFELDENLLKKIEEDPNNTRALMEVIRKVKLRRNITKLNKQDQKEPWAPGFE
jgi:hypothetical protein